MSTANLCNGSNTKNNETTWVQYADVWDSLGTNLQNITKDVTKYHIDRNGEQASFHGRNREQARVDHQVHDETLEDIADANGGELHSIDLAPETRTDFFETWDVAFVDYFAP